MKKLLTVLLIGASLLTVSCGNEEVEGNNVESNNIESQSKYELTNEHMAVLDGNKTYEEMEALERTKALEVVEDMWEEQNEEFKGKYSERKDAILKSKDEAVLKWAEADKNKENIKIAAEEATKEYEVSSLDILTLNEGGYSISVQIKSDVDPLGVANELANKLKEINEVYDVQVIDSKYQLTAWVDNNGIVEMN